mgnify:FL=1
MKEKIWMFFGFRKGGVSSDRYSLHFILLALALIIILTFYEIYFIDEKYTLYWPALVLFLIGAVIRSIARIQLGKLFTFNVKIMEDHTLQEEGFYRYMRHPGYTGLLLEVLAWCLFFQTMLGSLVTLFVFLPAGWYRIKIEEQTLEKNIPGYTEYKKKVKSLIPYVF